MSIAVHTSGCAAGAEITGFNLATELNDVNFAVIQNALDEHGVIYLRNQALTPEQQVAFTERFGEPDVNFNALRFGVDGSPTMVAQLQDRFDNMANHFHACDFTDTLHFEGPFDLLIDRGSLPHNSDADIRKTVNLAYDALHSGAKLISVDCCSDQHYGFTAGDPGEDPYTRINFTDGALAGTGKVHFSDSSNIRDIFSDWSIFTGFRFRVICTSIILSLTWLLLMSILIL